MRSVGEGGSATAAVGQKAVRDLREGIDASGAKVDLAVAAQYEVALRELAVRFRNPRLRDESRLEVVEIEAVVGTGAHGLRPFNRV